MFPEEKTVSAFQGQLEPIRPKLNKRRVRKMDFEKRACKFKKKNGGEGIEREIRKMSKEGIERIWRLKG
jgi:hypothetical protein